jgi:murein L,D-transpeptidase YcbB/YkuD
MLKAVLFVIFFSLSLAIGMYRPVPESSQFFFEPESFCASHDQSDKLQDLLQYYQRHVKNEIFLKKNKLSPKNLKRLQQRLIQYKFLPENQSASLAQIIKALKQFQKSQGLPLTETLDSDTLDALNTPLKKIIPCIKANIERWKKITHFTNHHVVINIPAFYLYIFRDNKIYFSTPVIVGKLSKPTPQLNNYITKMVIHPTWYIPPSKINELKGNAGSRGYAWENGRLIQRPCRHNPLGPIKFLFKDPGDILLHGTNKPHLFEKSQRTESLGCVRIQSVVKFASHLLDGEKSFEDLESLIQSGRSRYINLKHPISLHVIYSTIWVDSLGFPHFYDDVYHRDSDEDEDEDGDSDGD